MIDFGNPALAITLGIICLIYLLPRFVVTVYVVIINFIKYTILRKKRPKHNSFIPTNYAHILDEKYKREIYNKIKGE
jgi:hypothetical protein